MGIQAGSKDRFDSLLRLAASSFAEPPWFAPPVDVIDESDSLTIEFHVPGSAGAVHVTTDAKSLYIRSVRRHREAVRVCALANRVVPNELEVVQHGDSLTVRIRKATGKHAA
jgi:HSP20 family molecular chaperone IbpA